MQLLRFLALAFWLFGFVQCAFRGADLKAAAGITELEWANTNDHAKFAFWHKIIPAPKNPMELTDLYTEASKAFNWLRTQPYATTQGNSAIVAAFYDHRTQKVYMSTIMRGYLFNEFINKETYGKIRAPLWWQARNVLKRADAENGAFFYREETGPPVSDRTYGNTKTGKPEGSKIVAWGVQNIRDAKALPKLSGTALRLCYECGTVAYNLDVEFDDAQMERYRLLPPPPDTKQPPPKKADAPAPEAKERPVSPNPQAKGNPATPPPKPAGDKAPSSGSSFGGKAIDKAWDSEEEERMRQREGSKKNPTTPPPKPAGDKAPPSSGSPFGGKAIDKAWNSEAEKKMQEIEKSKKRPPTQSPEDSGKHKPPGPTTPSALVHRPADGNKSPTPGPAPRRRSLARQRRRSTSRLNSHSPGLTHRSPGRLRRRSPKKLGRPSFGRFARRSPERVYRDSVRQLSRHHST